MSLNFDAEQFENAFKAQALRNWEVPKWFPDRPCPRTGSTKIISNDRGHLLPGISRPPRSPWGNFVSTWKLPQQIDRDLAKVLSQPDPGKKKAWMSRCIHPSIVPAPCYKDDAPARQTPSTKVDTEPVQKVFPPQETSSPKHSPKVDLQPSEEKVVEDTTDVKNVLEDSTDVKDNDISEKLDDIEDKLPKHPEFREYIPGDLTESKHRHPSYEMLNRLRPKSEYKLPQIDHTHCRKHSFKDDPVLEPLPPELADAISNFQIAKQFHKENLEHHPLPETVTDVMYRKLQMERHRNPGLALPDEACVTGVGYKGYGASGPTQCTKLKVYRPKTCGIIKDAHKYDTSGRPCPGHKNTRFITEKDVTPMQLALCWDVIPENPGDEPKRTTHIDGSNGSSAPAVFTMVQSPKTPLDVHEECTNRSSSAAKRPNTASIFTKMEENEEIHMQPRKNVPDWDVSTKQRAKTAWPEKHKDLEICSHVKDMRITDGDRNNNKYTTNESRRSSKSDNIECQSVSQHSKKSNESIQSDSKLLARRHCHSSPNLSIVGDKSNICDKAEQKERFTQTKMYGGRPACLACESKSYQAARPRSEYKMAFKAGKPSSSTTGSSNSGTGTTTNSPGSSKVVVNVPKQRDPYSKKNYRIGTLAPPFSLRPGKRGLDYPEHWRLASVYQHSYKPLVTRKRPLLATVYQ